MLICQVDLQRNLINFPPVLLVDTFLTNHVFDGARCDITKVLTPNFQVTHSFAMGAASSPSSYNFGTAFIGQQVRTTL
jgi:hypothetical protein